MGNKKPDQPSRGIEGIAHLFLSGHGSREGRVVRRGPGSDGREAGSEKDQAQAAPDKTVPEGVEMSSRKRVGVGILCEHLEDWQEKLIHFARQTSTHEGPVGLVCFDRGRVRLMEYGQAAEQAVVDTVIDSAWQELFGPQQADRSIEAKPSNRKGGFSGSLDELDSEIETVLVQIPESGGEEAAGLIQQCGQLVVFSGCEKSQIVDAYRIIKWLGTIAGYEGKPGVFVFGAKDEQESASVYETLSNTAKRFLQMELEWAGGEIPITEGVREREVSAVKKDERILGELADYLAESGTDRTNQANGQKEDALGADGVQPTGLDVYEPIMVESFPRSDVELSDRLEVSLAVWLKGIPAVMVLPLPALAKVDRAARVIVDSTGRLWVFCGSLQEPASLLCRGLAVRKWAVDHLSLIKGNFSQVKIEVAFPVGLILVSGGEQEPLRDGCSQIEGIPCQTFRLTFLQKGEQQSILIA